MLSRTGTMGFHSFNDNATYIYSVGDNVLSKIEKGKITREVAPENNLARWRNLIKYTKNWR